MSKYNFDLELESRNSLSLLIERIVPNSRVLEFGPAHGRMTKYLKEKLNCEVYTVELDEDAAKDAAKYSKEIVVGNIETYEWLNKYENISFDYIVFADVLEHLYNPEEVLKKSKKLLKDDGSVLISLPNIAHNAVIIDLLQDKFEYRPTGLLDNTHIRFFTKKSIDAFIQKCGLKIAYETGVYVSPEYTEFANDYTSVEEDISSGLYKRQFGEVYQFIVEAKKNFDKSIVDLNKEEVALLFWDTGQGFNNSEMLETTFSLFADKKIIFTLGKNIENVKAVRIDPLDWSMMLEFKQIKINEKIFNIENIEHNGIVIDENKIIFTHNDPQIIVILPVVKSLQKVELLFEKISNIKDFKTLKLLELEQQLQQKDQQIQNLNQTVAELQELAESMRLKNRIKNLISFKKSRLT